MKIYIERDDKTLSKEFEGSVKKLLAKLNINPQTVIVVCNGALVIEDDKLKDKDEIKILSVISGG